MNLPATLYTLTAIGFFALMVNRPPVEISSNSEATKPVASTEVSEPISNATTNTSSSADTTLANEPPKDSGNSTTPTN